MWTTQCNSTFETLKDELCKILALQYPNPNKPYNLFTDASKYSYSTKLNQEKEGNADNPKTHSIISCSFGRPQQLWNTTLKYYHAVYKSIQTFYFF